MRPAYLVDTLKTLFPTLVVTYPQTMSALEQIVTATEGVGILADGLREYASGTMPAEKEKELFTIYEAYADEKVRAKRDLLTQAAWKRYEDSGLAAAVARALYGTHLENSVTRLETFAQCAYRHFLQYGLGLKERDEFGFETVDMGNIYHAILEQFAGKLAENNLTWFDFNEAFATRTIRETLAAYAATYGETVLYSSARNEYAITRMGRILTRTVMTLQEQLRHGSFKPDAYELSFRYADTLESVSVALSKEEKMRLRGRIDRIDIATDDEHIYVKVIDYKSGKKDFSLAALYYGLQLQLVVYMNAAMEYERKKHPDKEVVPAALLYYRVTDPEVEALTELSDEEIDAKILRELRMAGAVNSDPYIVNKLDADLVGHSEILPIEKNKDGSISARSSVYDRTDLDTISSYVSKKIVEIGREILDGKISLNPYEIGNENACEWCPYKHVCGFEPHLPGCKRRSLEKLNKETAFEKMREKLEGAQEV
jgi:ATP-dependent helicase/nuclease subunit B